MKRWLLAVAALLGPLVGLASADYVIIKIDLNKFFPSKDNPQGMPGMPGMPGGMPGGKFGGMMGGMPGGMPGGMQGGMPGGMQGGMPGGMRGGYPGGMPGGYGMRGGMPGGYPGGSGMRGGMPGGYPGGMPGGMRGGMPGGYPGAPGSGGTGSFPGSPTGGTGGTGGFGGFPGMPGDPNNPDEANEPEYRPLWAYAYLELKRRPKQVSSQDGQHQWLIIDQKWGKPIYVPGEAIRAYIRADSLAKRWEKKYKADLKDGKTPELLLALAEWALERGLLNEFYKVIDELKQLAPTNPTLKIIEQTRAALKNAPNQDDPAAASLIRELTAGGYRTLRSELGHYTLLTNAKNAQDDPSVKRRLAAMEDTYHVFFYWFALKGSPRTVPAYRLVAALAKDADPEQTREFESKHALFDQVPMVGDGFTARRDNVVLLSGRRIDEAFSTLIRNNSSLFKVEYKVTANDLLTNEKIMSRRQEIKAQIPVLQTLALMQHAMEEESEWATVTHECVRQLEAATNLIPRNVNAAEWAQFGLASFFETPHRSFYPMHGAANWNQLINFKYLRKTKKLNSKKASEILLDVITDRYFRQAYQSLRQQRDKADEKDKDSLSSKTADQLELARCTSWALTYYLANNHLDKLLNYYQELSNLPRDLEYNEDVVQNCFARAFGLLTADASDPSRKMLDINRVKRLANDWFNKMDLVQLDIIEVEQEGMLSRKQAADEAKAPKTNPNTQPGTNPTGQPGYGQPGYGPGQGGRFGPGGMGGRGGYGPPGMRPGGGGFRPPPGGSGRRQ